MSYYGARNVPFLDEPLRAPMQFHFGDSDSSIPRQGHRRCIARSYPTPRSTSIRPATPSIVIVDPKHYDADSARLAHRRTLEFFAQSLA